jgi:hypothetical protein
MFSFGPVAGILPMTGLVVGVVLVGVAVSQLTTKV